MNAEQYQRVLAVFEEVADLPEESQARRLDVLSEGDDELAGKVHEMLQEDAGQPSVLDEDADSWLGKLANVTFHSDHLCSLLQRRIGPYRLIRVLGEGGMGIVYLAERDDVGSLVAVKLLRDAGLSPARRERFLSEQRLLAPLVHPSIARFYDAGTMEDGTPWFAMEYVEGIAVTEYCRLHRCTLEQRLQLFREICSAVQYAHEHAIIHRDLKPSNILVRPDRSVRLLDFGIAKQLSDLEQTQTLRLLTPAYAAPEQIRGDTVGVFTDIYALGVILYELVADRLPFDLSNRSPGEVERTITEAEPERPSSTATRTGRSLATRTEWTDLDVLCLTALQKETQRRYRSAEAFRRDVGRFLENDPLDARPESAAYRLRKFVRRHARTLLAATAILVMLIALVTFFLIRLTRSRNEALAQAARVNRILDFTGELFDGGDPQAGPHMNLKVVDVLDRGRQEAMNLTGDRLLQTQLFTLLGTAYGKLGQMNTADQLLERAARQGQSMPGGEDGDHVKSLAALAELRRQERRLPEAEQLLRQAIAAGEHQRNGHDILERAHADLGSVLALGGQYRQAETELNMAIKLDARGNPPTLQYAEDLTQLAEVDHYLGAYGAAETLNRQALAINIFLRGKDHPAVAENLNNLSAIAQVRAQYGEAEHLQRDALAITERWYGPAHPAVADELSALSTILQDREKLEEAEAVLARALAIQMHTYGERHASVALIYNELGNLASRRNQFDEAEKDHRSAMAIWQQVYGPNHQFVGLSYSNLAGVYLDRKNYAEAEKMCRKALAIYSSALPGENINTAVAHLRLGRILIREDKLKGAEAESLAGYRFIARGDASSSDYLRAARKDLAQIELGLGHQELSARYAAEAAAAR